MEGKLGLESHLICWRRQLPDAHLPAILRVPGARPWLRVAESGSCPSQKVQAQLPRGFERERTSQVSTAPNIHSPASLFRGAKCPGKRLFLNSSASVASVWGTSERLFKGESAGRPHLEEHKLTHPTFSLWHFSSVQAAM